MKAGIINGIDFDKLLDDAKMDVMWLSGINDCNCLSGHVCLHWLAPSKRMAFLEKACVTSGTTWGTSTSKGFG